MRSARCGVVCRRRGTHRRSASRRRPPRPECGGVRRHVPRRRRDAVREGPHVIPVGADSPLARAARTAGLPTIGTESTSRLRRRAPVTPSRAFYCVTPANDGKRLLHDSDPLDTDSTAPVRDAACNHSNRKDAMSVVQKVSGQITSVMGRSSSCVSVVFCYATSMHPTHPRHRGPARSGVKSIHGALDRGPDREQFRIGLELTTSWASRAPVPAPSRVAQARHSCGHLADDHSRPQVSSRSRADHAAVDDDDAAWVGVRPFTLPLVTETSSAWSVRPGPSIGRCRWHRVQSGRRP